MSVKLVKINGDLIAEGESLVELVKANLADLNGANLSGANLGGSDLGSANLRSADLGSADLGSANLYGADLNGADLSGAYLGGADLRSADLRSADLYGADLRSANLYGADLSGVKNAEYAFAITMVCPPEGSFFAWKKCKDGVLVKLQIPAKAKRSCATGRKCRAEFAKVLEVIGSQEGISQYDGKTEYVKGKTVKCDKWGEDRWETCAGGIHFFITRLEAEDYK